ncbi:MAG: hypothetical protein O7F73_10245 [Gammaproteobacteria bacterium]|nr:hypothetical protein [Gammaproteobacteria bacterium]
MHRSIVVQQHPDRRRWLGIFAALLGLMLLLVGFFAGGYNGLSWLRSVSAENEYLLGQLQLARKQLDELQRWRGNREMREEIEGGALELVRQTLAEQQALIAELEQGIRFYKSLMAPGELVEGLSVRGIDLIPGIEAGRYQFRILVQQSARKHDLLTGTLRVELQGLRDGEQVSLELSGLSEQIPRPDIRLRFKYFQAIDGELELPEGFVPRKMIAYAKSSKPSGEEIRNEFPWSVQEKLTHVGQ